MIPKIIHYCWFGRDPLPDDVVQYIRTWKKYCPDYEIKEWNEDNFNLELFPYAREAYDKRKFAFVTDVVRLYALYNEGGIYLDTDVEITASLDKFLSHHAFSGFEDSNHISTGLIGSEKGGKWALENLDHYNRQHFVKPDGTMYLQTNVKTITKFMVNKGLHLNNEYQDISGYFTIYPCDFFSPKDYYTEKIRRTKNTHAIHHFSRSWCGKESQWQRFVRRHPKFNQFRLIPNKIGMWLLGNSYKRIRRFIKGK